MTPIADDLTRPVAPQRTAHRAIALCLLAALALPALAQPGKASPASAAAPAAERIYTRATVRGLPGATDRPAPVRLKILPRGKVPFSTLTFRVDDPRLLQGVAVGDQVGFIAEQRPGGNTLTALRKVAPCVRFQTCPTITDQAP